MASFKVKKEEKQYIKNREIKEASPLWDITFDDVDMNTGYYAPKDIPESWKVNQIRERIKVPKIVKEEYGLEPFFHKRAKYYVYGLVGGVGLVASGLATRNLIPFLSGGIIGEGAIIGYVTDYKHQVNIGKGFKGRKIYTFADGTKILADDKASAIETYKRHHHHKSHPHHFHLFGIGEKK